MEMNETNWQARASAWELAALSFRYPDAALTEAVASGEWAEAAREIAEALALELPQDFAAGLDAVNSDASALLHLLRPEATRLFVGAPEPACSPYEGVWRANDDGVQALLFVNPHSMEVERFMRSCGLGRPEGTNEPLDHVSTECELLEHLALRNVGLAEFAHLASDALPGGSVEAAYDTFFTDHVRAWMPRFAQAVVAKSHEPFYRAAAQLLEAVVG